MGLIIFNYIIFIDTCKVNAHFENIINFCNQEFSPSIQEYQAFGLNWAHNFNSSYADNIYNSFQITNADTLNSYSYTGRLTSYPGGGYVYKLKGNNIQTLKDNLNILKTVNWIDRQTSALFIEFTLFNANLNLYQYCSILFEIIPSGSFINTAEFRTLDLADININGLFTLKILLSLVYLAFIFILMLVELNYMIKMRLKYLKVNIAL